ncbi:MAG TPA: hypothetical protein VNI83_07130 [Vicinamibacterales bacterium]|nr:hypothetical protein [Vicinamibacterales bacterium]
MTRFFSRHLSSRELVTALETRRSGLGRRRAAHLAGCPRCRAELDRAERMWRVVESAEVPEPSPLFWDAFSARVRRAIEGEPAPAGGGRRSDVFWAWFSAWRFAAAAVALAAAVAAAVLLGSWSGRRAPEAPGAPGAALTRAPAGDTADIDAVDADGLSLVAEAAGLDWELAVAAGVAPRRDAAEWALLQLSDDERRELARLLSEELSAARYP